MKCPVCKKDCSATDTSCTNCGFDQINKEFINQDELLRWMEETVLPCQKVYRTMLAKVNEKNDTSLSATHSEDNNWNYDEVLIHPKSFQSRNKDYSICEVSDIEYCRNDDGSGYIQFIAKKTFDSKGDSATSWIAFRYKIKDSRGLVVTSDLWTGSDLVVGDAVERRIYFNDIPKGSRIEFSDNL